MADSKLTNLPEVTSPDNADLMYMVDDTTDDKKVTIKNVLEVPHTVTYTTEIGNTAGDLKVEPDVQGNVTYFEDTDVGDASAGKSLIIYRKAAEGDNSLTLGHDSGGQAKLESTGHMIIYSDDAKEVRIQHSSSGNIRLGSDFKGSGTNQWVRQFGYITADTSSKYVEWKLDDSDDYFHLTPDDAFVLGFKCEMDLEVTGNIIPSGFIGLNETTPTARIHIVPSSAVENILIVSPVDQTDMEPDIHLSGGEAKFGDWRLTHSNAEAGHQLTYNTEYDSGSNTFLGRDSGTSTANICVYSRINVAEGGYSGMNSFEIRFAPGANAGVAPVWADGSAYNFYDGSEDDGTGAIWSQQFNMYAAGGMDVTHRFATTNWRGQIRADQSGYKFFFERQTTGTWFSQDGDTGQTRRSCLTMDMSNYRVGISNDSPDELLSLGTAGTTLGVCSFAGSTSGKVTVQPAVAAGTWTFTLPTGAGTDKYVLSTNGSGVTSWIATLANVVEDTTPQLGGNLDWNSNGMMLVGQTVGGSNDDLVYLSSANTWTQADADAEATCKGMLGIRISAATVLTHGLYTTSGLTAGAIYYASTTAGGITVTAPSGTGDIVRIIGYALSTTELFVDPDKTYIEVS